MSINTAVNIDVNVDGTQTVKQAAVAYEDLGDAFAKTQRQAEELALQYGINDERTKEAIKTAGRYKQQLEQLDQAIDAHRGGQETLFRAVQGVTAGFEVATGAMALFGSESEDLNKILVKVQGAMIFSQGLKDLKEFSPAIKNLASSVTGPLISAFKSFGTVARTAIASTGIGVFVVAVGSLVAYWDQIKASLIGVSKEQSDLLDLQTETSKKAQEQLDSISSQENILRLQGKTEREILELKVAQTKSAITGLEAQLLTQKQVKESQIETAKRNKEILTGILRFVQAPIYAILKGVDLLRKGLGQTSDLAEGYIKGIASFVFDPEEVETKANETIQATEKQLLNLRNSLAGNQLAIKKIDEDAYNAKKEKDAKEAEDLLKKQQQQQSFIDETNKARREFNEVQSQQLKSTSDAIIENTRLSLESVNILFDKSVEKQMSSLDRIKLGVKAYGGEFYETFKSAFEAVASLEEAFGSESESRQRRAFEIRKAIALAETTISSIEATQNAFNSAQKSPITSFFPAYPFIQAGIAAAFGLAKIKEIQNQKFKSNAVPSLSSSGASVSVPSTLRSSNLNVGNEFVTADRRVYVLQGDITRTINNVNNTRAVSVVE